MTTYCGECGKECEVLWEDVGIGAYEYWGQKGRDVQIVPFSDCCEGEVFEDEDLSIEYSGSPEDGRDYPEGEV